MPAGLRPPCLPQPRALNYGERSPSRLQREPSLRGTPAAKARLASTPARTPRQLTRFGSQPASARPEAPAAAAATADPTGASMSSDNIRVVLRVRPRNERESSLGGGTCVQPLGSAAVRVASHPEPHSFSFDYVAGDSTTQETIFRGAWPGGGFCREWAFAAAAC